MQRDSLLVRKAVDFLNKRTLQSSKGSREREPQIGRATSPSLCHHYCHPSMDTHWSPEENGPTHVCVHTHTPPKVTQLMMVEPGLRPSILAPESI